ncbi:MAG TPA: hypothetical protein VGM80_03420 [Gaiellaceae bacterium]
MKLLRFVELVAASACLGVDPPSPEHAVIFVHGAPATDVLLMAGYDLGGATSRVLHVATPETISSP